MAIRAPPGLLHRRARTCGGAPGSGGRSHDVAARAELCSADAAHLAVEACAALRVRPGRPAGEEALRTDGRPQPFGAEGAGLAVGETVIWWHPPVPSLGVSIAINRGCRQNDSLAGGYAGPASADQRQGPDRGR